MANIYDLWTDTQKAHFQEDGDYRPEVKQRLLGMGANPAVLAENEVEMQEKVRLHLENDAVGPDRWGRLWSDYQLGRRVPPPPTRYQIPLEQAIEFDDSDIS
jgi:hypothetical protein